MPAYLPTPSSDAPLIVLTGSVATDELMRFDGRFADVIVPEQLSRLSISFLAQDMELRRGGTGANIAFTVGSLGVRGRLVASAGPDFTTGGYADWLSSHGVELAMNISDKQLTSRFTALTDQDNCQICSFYAGAMTEARDIAIDFTGVDLLVVSPNDTDAMARHTREARDAGVPFVADTSQQLTYLSDPEVLVDLIDGAAMLMLNDYEQTLLQQKTGLAYAAILDRVGVSITTRGADGATADAADGTQLSVPAPPTSGVVDPTGAGDALRGGFLAAWSWGLDLERCLQVGQVLAVLALEAVGPQDPTVEQVADRLAVAYGKAAADEVSGFLPS